MAYSDTDKQAFLDQFALHGNKSKAAKATGLKTTTINTWLSNDEQFADAYALALEEAADVLEDAAFKRAVDGVERKRFDKEGNLILTETIYSDSLLSKLLDGAKPEKFKQRTATELSGPGGKPIDMSDTTAAARIAALLDMARRRRDEPAPDIDPLS